MAGAIVLVGVGLWIILQTTYGPLAAKLGFGSSPAPASTSSTTTGGTAAAATGQTVLA